MVMVLLKSYWCLCVTIRFQVAPMLKRGETLILFCEGGVVSHISPASDPAKCLPDYDHL